MAALRRWKNTFDPRKLLGCLEHARLLHSNRLHKPIGIQLGKYGAHAMVSQSAGMVRGRDEAAAQRVHLRQRADHSGIAEIVCELSSGKARAGCRFHGDKAVILLSSELFTHER